MRLIILLLLAWTSMDLTANETGPAREQLENFSNGLVNLRAEFSQVVKSQDGTVQDQTLGRAWLQSPNKLRWVYSGDFPETIVADGNNVWIHDESLQQVTVQPQSAEMSNTPLLILTELSQLDEQFKVTELGEYEAMNLLELRSHSPESEFERILVGTDPSGIRMMIMEDAFGQRTEIHFSDIERNGTIDPKLFSFEPPEDTDVVGDVLSVR